MRWPTSRSNSKFATTPFVPYWFRPRGSAPTQSISPRLINSSKEHSPLRSMAHSGALPLMMRAVIQRTSATRRCRTACRRNKPARYSPFRERQRGPACRSVCPGLALRASLAFSLLIATFAPSLGLQAQLPAGSVRVAVGFGVDTVGTSHEIFALWRAYLSSGPSCSQQSPLWSASERAQWPVADLLCSNVYQGFSKFTVVHLAPAVGLDSTYLIRTLVASVSDSGQDVQPLAL